MNMHINEKWSPMWRKETPSWFFGGRFSWLGGKIRKWVIVAGGRGDAQANVPVCSKDRMGPRSSLPTPVKVFHQCRCHWRGKRGNLWMKTNLDCHWDLSLVLHIYKESMLQSASVAVGKRRRRDTASGVGEPCKVGHPILHQTASRGQYPRMCPSSLISSISLSVCQ